MKTLGMIGGTSWHSTIDYYRFIIEKTEEAQGHTKATPPLLLYSIDIALMRTQDWDLVKNGYLEYARNLEKGGAEAIIICAHTPHKVIPFVGPQIDIPFIHIAEGIGRKAREMNIRKIGLIGTKPVTEEDFIKGPLQEQFGLEVLVPGRHERFDLHKMIVKELTQGKFTPESKNKVIEVMDGLKEAGAEAIILGCTEFPILLKDVDYEIPLFNSIELHAERAIKFIIDNG